MKRSSSDCVSADRQPRRRAAGPHSARTKRANAGRAVVGDQRAIDRPTARSSISVQTRRLVSFFSRRQSSRNADTGSCPARTAAQALLTTPKRSRSGSRPTTGASAASSAGPMRTR